MTALAHALAGIDEPHIVAGNLANGDQLEQINERTFSGTTPKPGRVACSFTARGPANALTGVLAYLNTSHGGAVSTYAAPGLRPNHSR